MKHTIKLILLAYLSLLFIRFTIPKNHFEGRIIFAITYKELPEGAEQYAAMLPQETTLYIKDEKTRTEQGAGMGGSQVIIANSKTEEAVVLMDVMGQKLMMKMNKDELRKEDGDKPKITYLDESLEISGYKCKKAEVVFNNDDTPLIVYYTDEIPAQSDNHFDGLNGFPLQYEIRQNNMSMVMKAKKVSLEEVPDKLFEIPEGYREVSQDQLKQMFGG